MIFFSQMVHYLLQLYQTQIMQSTVFFMRFSITIFSIFADVIIFVFVLGFAFELLIVKPVMWLREKCSCECIRNIFLRVIMYVKSCGTPDNRSKCECKWPLSWHMFLRFATTVLFLTSYGLWFSAWNRNKYTWNPKDKMFQDSDIIYSVASVMSFLHLTFILRVDRRFGTLEISLINMLKDVFYFAVLFFFLFLSFATGIRKLYSYHASATNKEHQLGR